jgi:hypothetical protein
LRIQSKPNPLGQPQAYSFLPEAESSKSNIEIDEGSASGKRTQDSPTARTENKDQRSSSNSNKRRDQNPENIITTPPPFHINSCTMSYNEEIFHPKNNDPPPLSREAKNQLDTSHIDPSAPGSDDTLTLLLEAAAYEQQEEAERSGKPLLMSSPIGLQIVKEILAGPSNPPVLANTPEGEEIR